jgi:hypothetical protein
MRNVGKVGGTCTYLVTQPLKFDPEAIDVHFDSANRWKEEI